VPVIGDLFQFTLGHNTGVAFGLFASRGPWPLVVTGLVILGLSLWTLVSTRASSARLADVPFGLILGGALGNFVDRLHDSRVTDFLDFGLGAARWPTFNLADTSIVLGVTFLLALSLCESHSSRMEHPAAHANGRLLPWKGGVDDARDPNP